MKDYGIVYGSAEQAKPLVVGKDTVYVHTDIKEVELEDGSKTFQYHEIQYTKDEYIALISEKNSRLESDIIDTQAALIEIATIVGGAE